MKNIFLTSRVTSQNLCGPQLFVVLHIHMNIQHKPQTQKNNSTQNIHRKRRIDHLHQSVYFSHSNPYSFIHIHIHLCDRAGDVTIS